MKNLSLAILVIALASCQPDNTTIYVSADGHRLNPGTHKSPVGTVEQAQQVIKEKLELFPGEDITVKFSEGIYYLDKTWVIMDKNPEYPDVAISYEGISGHDVVVSGGQKIENWIVEDGIWKAHLPDIESIEQLYVNGERAQRARIPNIMDEPSRWYLDSVHAIKDRDGDTFIQFDIWLKGLSDIPDFNTGGRAEIVVYKDWATLRHEIAGYDNTECKLALRPPFAMFDGNYNGLLAPYVNRFTCYLEGHPAFIDSEGEWAFDAIEQMIFYKPFEGQSPDESDVIIPLVESLLMVSGNEEKRISNIHFRNIQFKHAAYRLPEFGHDGRQACFYYSKGTGIAGDQALLTDAIRLEWADNCSFTACQLSQTGGNGIYLSTGCQNITLDQFNLTDIGGNALMIGMARDPGLESEELVKGIHFRNGIVSQAGQHFDSAVGIWLGFCRDCSVVGNEVFDLPYTGISVGWQWNPVPSSSGGNLIEDNHIYQVMQMLGDGGGIYTLGFQPGSIIRGNRIHEILRSELNHASPNNGMFIDEGSRGYLIDGNHIYDVAHTCIRGHRAAGVELRNNKFESGEFPAISHTPPYGNMIFSDKDSTIIWNNPGWPAEWGYSDSVTAFTMNNNVFIQKQSEE